MAQSYNRGRDMSAGLLCLLFIWYPMTYGEDEATALPVFRLIHQNKAETSELSLQDLLQ
jgi:hypothetical protein